MTSNTGPLIPFWSHRKLAEAFFFQEKLLMPDQFEQVDWPMVHDALHKVPRMFQVWACKHVMGIAGTNFNQSQYQQDNDPKCPSCDKCVKTCSCVALQRGMKSGCASTNNFSAGQVTQGDWNRYRLETVSGLICVRAWGGHYGRNITRNTFPTPCICPVTRCHRLAKVYGRYDMC